MIEETGGHGRGVGGLPVSGYNPDEEPTTARAQLRPRPVNPAPNIAAD